MSISDNQKGFTIVELLIVIVVIAILASISIVTYSGIQQRARDSKRRDDVAKIAKGLTVWSIGTSVPFDSMTPGHAGPASGWLHSGYGGQSIKAILVASGNLSDSVRSPSGSDYMVAPCTTATTDNRRVVMTRLENPPTDTVAQQISSSACDHPIISNYTTTYSMNYAVMADAR